MKEEKTNPSFPIPKDIPRDIIESFVSYTQKLSLVKQLEDGKSHSLVKTVIKKAIAFYESDIEKGFREKRLQRRDLFYKLTLKMERKFF